MLLLLLGVLLLLLLFGLSRLSALRLFGLGLLFALLLLLLLFDLRILLCVGKSGGSEKERQNCYADNSNSFHGRLPLLQLKCNRDD